MESTPEATDSRYVCESIDEVSRADCGHIRQPECLFERLSAQSSDQSEEIEPHKAIRTFSAELIGRM